MEQHSYINSVNLNQNTGFPYLVLNIIDNTSYPRNPGFQVMHWHEDLQFIYVLSGKIEVVTLESSVLLQAGEAVFINKNVVHLVKKSDSCHYNSFIFPDHLLKFYPGSPAGTIVEQLSGNESLPLFHIQNLERNRGLLDMLKKLIALEQNKTPLYPYEVLTTLCSLWLKFIRTVNVPQTPQKNIVGTRMSIFLHYIEQNYQSPISLDDLAESAHVSKSECLRCFKLSLQTAPYQYLMEYRLSKAADLLKTSTLPIGDISASVGFNQVSHFGKYFRQKTGMSPSEYRNHH